MNPTIESFKAESKYRLTAKEKSFIKRNLKTLNCSQFTLSVSAVKNILSVTVIVHDSSMIDIDATRRSREKYGQYCLPQLNETLRDKIELSIDAIVLPHQTCYSERDTMTDYFGSYRIDFYWVKFEVDSKIKEQFSEVQS